MAHSEVKCGLRMGRLGYHGAINVLTDTRPDDLREVDLRELLDIFGQTLPRKALQTIELFPTLLKIGLGLLDPSAKIVAFQLTRFYDTPTGQGRNVFIASTARVGLGWKSICGFGWRYADPLITRRQRIEIARYCIEELVIKDEWQRFFCLVHPENEDTLKSWRIIARLYPGLWIDFKTHHWLKNYIRVEITKKDLNECASQQQSH